MLTPVTATLLKGDRVLAMGHPRDLGLSIVEGTYNGQVEHVLTPRLHFTGPLNPGMSGGPAVTPALPSSLAGGFEPITSMVLFWDARHAPPRHYAGHA